MKENKVKSALNELIGVEVSEILTEVVKKKIKTEDHYELGKLLEKTFRKGMVFAKEISDFIK